MPTSASAPEGVDVPVRRVTWGPGEVNAEAVQFSLEPAGTTALPSRLAGPGAMAFHDDHEGEFAFVPPGSGNAREATIVAKDAKGNWVDLSLLDDAKRFGRFIQDNRSQITTGIKVVGFGLVAAGVVVKGQGAPATGGALQDAGNYLNNATAGSDIAHYFHSAVKTIREKGLTPGAVKDAGKVLAQAFSLGTGIASIALEKETVTQALTPIAAAAAAVATGKTSQEEMKQTESDVMGKHPEAYLEAGRLHDARSMTLRSNLDSSSDGLRSGTISRVGTGMTGGPGYSTGSEVVPGQLAKRPTFSHVLGDTPEEPVNEPVNPIHPGCTDSLVGMPVQKVLPDGAEKVHESTAQRAFVATQPASNQAKKGRK